jgi:hypothetical protein
MLAGAKTCYAPDEKIHASIIWLCASTFPSLHLPKLINCKPIPVAESVKWEHVIFVSTGVKSKIAHRAKSQKLKQAVSQRNAIKGMT